eukprot:CAMPEP_0176050272 /NCGR_PEP_ID=MMETSP0120_2-20121206/24986_1 /TAXON_ID=160619 /ORGANISM="Kryptoperidinium foliaceum, Strain CCMP 1326" /LENGTH=736 /DNA_ID=CAMNT_0017383705 /DNA_START=79 /DNA_END=2286 /DNA_ORIENTATION=-
MRLDVAMAAIHGVPGSSSFGGPCGLAAVRFGTMSPGLANGFDAEATEAIDAALLPVDAERRAALLSLAKLFHAPASMGVPSGTMVLPPFGFDSSAAEFHPAALMKLTEGDGFSQHWDQGADVKLGSEGFSSAAGFGSRASAPQAARFQSSASRERQVTDAGDVWDTEVAWGGDSSFPKAAMEGASFSVEDTGGAMAAEPPGRAQRRFPTDAGDDQRDEIQSRLAAAGDELWGDLVQRRQRGPGDRGRRAARDAETAEDGSIRPVDMGDVERDIGLLTQQIAVLEEYSLLRSQITEMREELRSIRSGSSPRAHSLPPLGEASTSPVTGISAAVSSTPCAAASWLSPRGSGGWPQAPGGDIAWPPWGDAPTAWPGGGGASPSSPARGAAAASVAVPPSPAAAVGRGAIAAAPSSLARRTPAQAEPLDLSWVPKSLGGRAARRPAPGGASAVALGEGEEGGDSCGSTSARRRGAQPGFSVGNGATVAIEVTEGRSDIGGPPDDGGGWSFAATDTDAFCGLFAELEPDKRGSLTAAVAKEVLEASGLPVSDLAEIWRLSDVDADGKLTIGEFVCAMHLASGRRGGLSLPDALPESLIDICIAVEEAAQDMPGATTSRRASVSNSEDGSSARWPEDSRAFDGRGDTDFGAHWSGIDWGQGEEDDWPLSADELDRRSQDFVTLEEARPALECSELPWDELQHLWGLCQPGNFAPLSRDAFVCVMHLTSARRAGRLLPVALPP